MNLVFWFSCAATAEASPTAVEREELNLLLEKELAAVWAVQVEHIRLTLG